MRLAANHAVDRQAINESETLGLSKLTWSIIPNHFEFYWQRLGYRYDPARARQLLAEAGYPNGFDAGKYSCDTAFGSIGEAMVNYLQAAGIRAKLQPLERVAFFRAHSEKKHRGLIQEASVAFGNAATRIEAFVASGGAYAYGSYPDIDGTFREQATEAAPKRRGALLERQLRSLEVSRSIVTPRRVRAVRSALGARASRRRCHAGSARARPR